MFFACFESIFNNKIRLTFVFEDLVYLAQFLNNCLAQKLCKICLKLFTSWKYSSMKQRYFLFLKKNL